MNKLILFLILGIFSVPFFIFNDVSAATSSINLDSDEYIMPYDGNIIVSITITDPDINAADVGEDFIGTNTANLPIGPVKISVVRGTEIVVLGYAGGPNIIQGVIDVGDKGQASHYLGTDDAIGGTGSAADSIVFASDQGTTATTAVVGRLILPVFNAGADNTLNTLDDEDKIIRQFGPIDEIVLGSGTYQLDLIIRYTDGPVDVQCPVTLDYVPINGASDTAANPVIDRFSIVDSNSSYCILDGDILKVEYTDPTDMSSNVSVSDSATFVIANVDDVKTIQLGPISEDEQFYDSTDQSSIDDVNPIAEDDISEQKTKTHTNNMPLGDIAIYSIPVAVIGSTVAIGVKTGIISKLFAKFTQSVDHYLNNVKNYPKEDFEAFNKDAEESLNQEDNFVVDIEISADVEK